MTFKDLEPGTVFLDNMGNRWKKANRGNDFLYDVPADQKMSTFRPDEYIQTY